MDMVIFVLIYCFSLISGIGIAYSVNVLNASDHVFKCIVVFIACMVIWSLIYTHAFGSADHAILQYGFVVGISHGNTLYGIFTYENTEYFITYFTLLPISVWSMSIITNNRLAKTSFVICALIGIYCSAQFMKRSSVACGMSAGLLVLAYVVSRRRQNNVVSLFKYVLLLSLPLTGICLFIDQLFPQYGLFLDRLSSSFHDVRLDIWSQSISLLLARPFEGFRDNLSISMYAHNFFLDYAADYGVLGFIFSTFLFFYICTTVTHVLVRSKRDLGPVSIILLCFIVSSLAISLIEPLLPERILIILFSSLSFISINAKRVRAYSVTMHPVKVRAYVTHYGL